MMLSYLLLITICLAIVFILFVTFRLKIIQPKATLYTLGIGLFSMLIFNTYLTSMPIVLYNTGSTLGVYLSSFPIEDIGYLIAVVLLVPALFEHYNSHDKK